MIYKIKMAFSNMSNKQILRIKELDPDMIAPSTKNMNKPEQGGSKIVVIGKPGCFKKGTKVLMFDGSLKNVEDIQVGDKIMGDDSNLRTVLELCRGTEEMYKIEQKCKKAEPYIVNKNHKLVIKNINSNHIVEIKVKHYLNMPIEWKNQYVLIRTGVNFEKRNINTCPYEMGKLVGSTKSIMPDEYIYNSKDLLIEFLRGFYEETHDFNNISNDVKNQIDLINKIIGVYYPKNDCEFDVIYEGIDNYYGFTIDGNHRFLLGSFDIVRNTGKTTLITSLLYEKSHIFSVGEVMSGTEDSNGHYGKIFPGSFVYNALDKGQIENFIKRQKLAKQHLPNPWAILLLDDCTDDPKLFNDPMFQGIFKNGRHWKMWFILSLQYSLDIKPVIRTNIDGTFILRETNLKNRRNLWENYAGIFPDFGQFCDVLDKLTDDYTALYVHNATTSNNLEDCVFWYKAKPIPPDFKIGCDEYWLYHEERYDKEQDKRI
jgi:hypothetical protein